MIVTVDRDSVRWRASTRRMVACEDRMVKRDETCFTGGEAWINRLHWHYSKSIFPGGEVDV
jgi:hypothetical protein